MTRPATPLQAPTAAHRSGAAKRTRGASAGTGKRKDAAPWEVEVRGGVVGAGAQAPQPSVAKAARRASGKLKKGAEPVSPTGMGPYEFGPSGLTSCDDPEAIQKTHPLSSVEGSLSGTHTSLGNGLAANAQDPTPSDSEARPDNVKEGPVFLGTGIQPPGVRINGDGNAVDEFGVLLSFTALRSKYVAHETALIGKPVETPAEVLKAAALDVRLPLSVRIDAAKNAAPYYDRKKPVAIDGGENPEKPNGPGLPIGIKKLDGLSDEELNNLETLLNKAEVVAPTDERLH